MITEVMITEAIVQTADGVAYKCRLQPGPGDSIVVECGKCRAVLCSEGGLTRFGLPRGCVECGAVLRSIQYVEPPSRVESAFSGASCLVPGGCDLDLNALECRRCFRSFEALDVAAVVPVSDHGVIGAIPLGPENPLWAPLDDADWSAQNRKINDLLAGRE